MLLIQIDDTRVSNKVECGKGPTWIYFDRGPLRESWIETLKYARRTKGKVVIMRGPPHNLPSSIAEGQ